MQSQSRRPSRADARYDVRGARQLWRSFWQNGLGQVQHEHVKIAVTDSERHGVEHVPARRVRGGNWELLRSPLYAMTVAAGDVIRITDDEIGAFEVVARGRNVCVQFYLGANDADKAETTTKVANTIALDIGSLGGRVDAQTPGLIAFSIPIDAGFPAIEHVFDAAIRRHPGSQWQYSNVYDPTTGEPLGWWEQQHVREN